MLLEVQMPGNTETVKITETKTISVYEIITYDIWKHINGVWQFGKAPGLM